MIASGAIGTDETRVTLLLPPEIPEAKEDDPKSRRIHEVFSEARAAGRKSVSVRMWAYRSLTVPINVFDFTVSRHRDGPDDVLVAGGLRGHAVGRLLLPHRRERVEKDLDAPERRAELPGHLRGGGSRRAELIEETKLRPREQDLRLQEAVRDAVQRVKRGGWIRHLRRHAISRAPAR